ncbi:hypothetical protein AC249_AIPGENE27280 [Exaiptasia diaphana]|nr:hypothetical protein AC249_AIPGENE27280 [Exaiptasia diaphana]
MGISSSTDKVTEISPRVEGFKTKKGQDLTLDSPALLDLEHGSIRYRLPDEKRIETESKVKTGYFYHPKLNAEIAPEEKFKLYYVFKGPKKDGKNKKLYYVYATSINAKDGGIKQADYRPQGLGYDWPESYRKANNLYYELGFLESSEEEFSDSDEESDQLSTVTTATPRIDAPVIKDNISQKPLAKVREEPGLENGSLLSKGSTGPLKSVTTETIL